MVISYLGIVLGYVNKGILFLLIFSTSEIGLINLILSIGLLFAQFANLGMVYSTWRFLPFFKNERNNHHGFLPLILLVALVGVVLCTLGVLVFKPKIEVLYSAKSALFLDYFYWILPIGIAFTFYQVLDVYLRGFYKNIVSVVAYEIVLRLVVTLLLVLFAFDLISFNFFVIAHSLSYFVPIVVLLIYLKRIGELNLRYSSIQIPTRFRKIILQFAAFNYINSMGIIVVASIDVMMIAQYIGLEATGVYSMIVFLAGALQVPFRSIVRISSPLVAEYWKHRKLDEMKQLYTNVSSVSLVIGLGSFLCVWMNIDFLFSFLKPEYQQGIWIFLFLMIGRLVDMYFGLNGSIFTTSKKYKYDIYFTLFLILAVFGLNCLFIPWWGAPGAAISTTIAILVYNIGRLLFVWFAYKIHPFQIKQFFVIGLAGFTVLIGEFVSKVVENVYVDVFLQFSLIGLLFLLPIYIFDLEVQTINFIKKGIQTVRIRLLGK